jgi:hypothetical protein
MTLILISFHPSLRQPNLPTTHIHAIPNQKTLLFFGGEDTERLVHSDTNTERLHSQDLCTNTDYDIERAELETEHPTVYLVQNQDDKPPPRDTGTSTMDNRDTVTVKRDNTCRISSKITVETVTVDVSLLSQYSVGEDLMRKSMLTLPDVPVVKVPIPTVLVHQEISPTERKQLPLILPDGMTCSPVLTQLIHTHPTELGSLLENVTAVMYSTTPTLQDVKKLQLYLAYKPI